MTISKLNIAKKESFCTFHKGTTAITLNAQTGVFYTTNNGIIGSVEKIGRSRFAVKALGSERETMELLGGEMCALEDIARHLLTIANQTPEQRATERAAKERAKNLALAICFAEYFAGMSYVCKIENFKSKTTFAPISELVAKLTDNSDAFVEFDKDENEFMFTDATWTIVPAVETPAIETIESNESDAIAAEIVATENESLFVANDCDVDKYLNALQIAVLGFITNAYHTQANAYRNDIETAFASEGETYIGLALSGLFTSGKTRKVHGNYEPILTTENTIEAIESEEVVVIEVPSLSEVDALTLECVISSVCGEVTPASIETVATDKVIDTKEVERLAAIASVQTMAKEQHLYPNFEIRLYRAEKIGYETVATFHSLLEWLERFPKHFRSYSPNSNRFLMSGMLYHVVRVSNVEIVESVIETPAIEVVETPVLSDLGAAVLECIYLSVCGEIAPSQVIEVPKASNVVDLDIFGVIETSTAILESVDSISIETAPTKEATDYTLAIFGIVETAAAALESIESVTPAIIAPVTTIETTAKHYSLPQYGIETSNLNIACEMLSDSYIYFALVDDDIIFPETPKKPAKAKGVTVKVITPAIEVQPEKTPEIAPKSEYVPIGSPEYLARLIARRDNKAAQPILVPPPIAPIMPQKPVKMPSLKVWDYSVTRNTLKLMREFLAKNKALLNAEKTEWYGEVYKAIEKECKKPIQDRMFMNDLIDYVELEVLAIGEKQSTCRVSLTEVPLSDGETSLYLTFSETIIHPDNGMSVKRLKLPNGIKTKPKSKPQIESNKAILNAAYLAVEAHQTKVNKGFIKLYVPKTQK